MEAAAKSVELLREHILPVKPHSISFHEDWRYRPRPDDGKRFEEWNNPRLQYLTLVSEADRGVLLTRSYYDMREEPTKPLPREVNALAKGGEKKKLSLSDYKNKKTSAASTSPPEPSLAKKKESERAAPTSDAPTAGTAGKSAATDAKPPPEARNSSESKRQDRAKYREPDSHADGKQRQVRDAVADPRPPPPKQQPPPPPLKHPLPPRPPSPTPRKRGPDLDDEPRPIKRSRQDGSRVSDEKAQLSRDDGSRRKERPGTASSSSSSLLPNGKAPLKNSAGSTRSDSHTSRPHSDGVNGTSHSQSSTSTTKNARATPTKGDSRSKVFLPPLLSPLDLSFSERGQEASPLKGEKRKREEQAKDGARSPKAKRVEQSSGQSLRKKFSRTIPPLLSPTLPPVVEEALLRRKKSSLDLSDERSKEDSRSPTKKKVTTDYSDDEDRPLHKLQRKSRIVTIKLPKKLRLAFRRMQALSGTSSSRREAQTQEHEPAVAEDAGKPAVARKRPVVSEPVAESSSSQKKPRSVEISSSSKLAAPTTPSKKGAAAMSRASSSNSLAQTPGDTVHATPSGSGNVEYKTNGVDAANPNGPGVMALRNKENHFAVLGRRLKHEADQRLASNPRRSPNGRKIEPHPRLGYVLSLESLLAFMCGFYASNLWRGMCHKRTDPSGWASLFPFTEYLERELRRNEFKRYAPLIGLLYLLQITACDELFRFYANFENPGTEMLRFVRTRLRALNQLRETNENIQDKRLIINPPFGATVDDVNAACIHVLRVWSSNEQIDWQPDPSLEEHVAPRSSST